MDSDYKIIGVGVLAIIIIALVFVLMPFVVVDSTERAVIVRLGTLDRVIGEGIHWKTPFLESAAVYDISTQKVEVEATAASKDLQDVSAKVAVQYNLNANQVDLLYREYKRNVESAVIAPAIQDAIKAGTAQFNAEALITNRLAVKDTIETMLRERLGEAYVNVTNVDIVNFSFSASFNNAIEAKVTAEQEAQKARNDLERVKLEAEQRIASAQAEAEAIRIQAEAITQQGGDNYVQLQAIQKWDGALPQQFVPNSAVPFLNL